MKRLKGKSAALSAFIAIALTTGVCAVCTASNDGDVDDANKPIVAENRWAIVFDASRPGASNEERARVDAARRKFCADLEASGILPDHIFVFTSTAEDESRRPTRETILNALETLRAVDLCDLYPTQSDEDKPFWRAVGDGDAPCEIQLYLTAPGVAATDGGSDWFAPCDAPLEGLDEAARADSWLRVEAIENALTRPEDETTTPIQRTFLAINFLSLETPTRGGDGDAAAREVDLERSANRGFDDYDAPQVVRYQHVRVATRNERWDARTVDSFYQTMSEGLRGSADLAGDRNGWVEARELAEYVRANGRKDAVAIAQNGNVAYALCPSRNEWTVPTELYREIEQIFTRPEYKKLRDSAKTRGRQAQTEKRGTAK